MTEPDQVSQVTEETPVEINPNFDLPVNHPALKALEKVRQEAASKRDTLNKERAAAEDKAKLWDEYQNSQKTEMERLAEERSALQSKLSELETGVTRQKILNEFKLDAEDEEFLTGTEDEMRSKAEKLAKRVAQKEEKVPTGADFLMAGTRGTPVMQDTDARSAGANFLDGWK